LKAESFGLTAAHSRSIVIGEQIANRENGFSHLVP
jgi:hypothetical protein